MSVNEDSYFSAVEVTAGQFIIKVEKIVKFLKNIMDCQKLSVKAKSEGLQENLRFKIDVEY